MSECICPVILCGGSGTRLWPLSTPDRPKQFLPLTSNKPMIVETADRFAETLADGIAFGRLLVVGSDHHRADLEQVLPTARLILEPMGRNSAPAVAAACLASKPDDLLLILPADHSIKDIAAFHGAISCAAPAARSGAIVTFGIQPTYAATGYGYIKAKPAKRKKVFDVDQFVEKPELATAEQYLAAGTYYWNAGIFLFQASTMQAALAAHAPDIIPAVEAALGNGASDILELDKSAFARAPNISIDYAVMEHAENVKVVPVDMGWSDVGDYQALWDLLADGGDDTVTAGRVVAQNTKRLYVNTEGPLVAVRGVSDLVVVATDDTVMITPRGDARAVKSVGQTVGEQRHLLDLSDTIISEATDWFWQTLNVWRTKAWDTKNGGFVEQLTLDGRPDIDAPRRVRVQARQIYSFARAADLGWGDASGALDLVEQGLAFFRQTLRHPEGGWVHTVGADGVPIDRRRELYDHSFIILAAATAYKVTGKEGALALVHDAADFVESQLEDQQNGGWRESLTLAAPRRANPHMHLLEAALAWHDATGHPQAMGIAKRVVELFETRFFDPTTNIMAEYFEADWQPVQKGQKAIWEPGHHYEWATLLASYDERTGHDTLSWRRRLIRQADQYGRDPASGFAVNTRDHDGCASNSNRRLWPQLEMFRAHLLHPGLDAVGSDEVRLRRILDTYLNWGPEGGWLDETDAQGGPYSQAIPASMIYHFVTAFAPLIE
ncbi:MAG: AGE family epimerase/isomerase [Pseudomonadota bacterium]